MGEKDAESTGVNRYTALIEEAEGLDKIELLQNHQNFEIYEKSMKILERYFAAEEEEDASIAPTVNPSANTFQFGMSPGQLPPGGFQF